MDHTKTLSDISCIFLHEISLESSAQSGFKNGIVITHDHGNEDRCFSYLGVCSGCGWPAQYGVPSTWQVLNLSKYCYDTEQATKHEILHAFGFSHEQSRLGIL